MSRSDYFLRFLRCHQFNIIFLTVFFFCGFISPGISETVESDIDEQSKIKINIVNFIYIIDGGYERDINISQEIERAIVFPAIEKTFRDLGISNYSLEYEKVSSGNIDYSSTNPSGFNSGPNLNRLVVWGMVKPLQWPKKYDLTLLFYQDSQPVYRASLNVRQGMITSWNQQKCKLPLQSLGLICGILGVKITSQNDRFSSEITSSDIETYITSRTYSLPADVKTLLVDWNPGRETDAFFKEGMLTLLLERGGTRQFIVDQSYNLQMERFLTTNKTMNWFLDQGGLMMPEIQINGSAAVEDLSKDDIRAPAVVRHMPRSISIGIIPFENKSGDKHESWLGFGLEYLLASKFSNIPAYKLVDQDVVIKFVESDSATVLVNEIEWSLDYTLGGEYYLHGDFVEIDISIAQAFGGIRIASEHYKIKYDEFFDVVDNTAEKFIQLTDVALTGKEMERFERRVTNSMEAFESFCMGYIENGRSDKDIDAVVQYFKSAIDEDPAFWGAYYNLGSVYYNLEMYKEALIQFDYIIDKFPSFELAYLGRGLTRLQNKQFNRAYEDFIVYRDNRAYDYRGWYYAGRCALQMKQYQKALGYLAQALELQPTYSRGYYELGNVYYTTNRYRRAIFNYNQSLNLDAAHIPTRKRLGESYYRMHNFVGAINQFEKILLTLPNDPEVNFMLGITVYKQAALDEYIDEFLEMYGLLNKEEIEANKNKHNGQKERIYNEMVSRFYLAQKERNNFYEATFNLALTYQEMGKPDSALYYYNKTLQINPGLAKAHIVLAKFYEKQQKYDQALEEYKKALRIDPRYFIDFPRLGPEFDNVDVLAQVTKDLEQEVRIDPNNISSSLSLANILYAQGFRGKAAALYRKVLSLQPEQKTAKSMLAKMGN